MKTKITILAILLCAITYGQKKRERVERYVDKNGYEYVIGEELILNEGSAPDGSFNYVTVLNALGGSSKADAGFSGHKFKIGTITKLNTRSKKRVDLTGIRGALIFSINLTAAVNSCEVGDCSNTSNSVVVQESDKYDKLSKLKKLLDQGVISQEEFDIEKKKVLEEN